MQNQNKQKSINQSKKIKFETMFMETNDDNVIIIDHKSYHHQCNNYGMKWYISYKLSSICSISLIIMSLLSSNSYNLNHIMPNLLQTQNNQI